MARSVIVTGGFGILGEAVSRIFTAAGDKVARIDFAPAPRAPLAGALDIGGVDLSDPVATASALDKVDAENGGIDVLINVAGGFTWETLADGSLESWTRMHTLNVLTGVTITKLALPWLTKSRQGRVVFIGAGGGVKGSAGMGPYAASKSGVHRLTETLAEELAGTSVTVNAILPSIIDTPTNRADMPDADFSTWVQPAAIGKVIAFLASPEAASITGALIPVTRGG